MLCYQPIPMPTQSERSDNVVRTSLASTATLKPYEMFSCTCYQLYKARFVVVER